MSAAGFPLDTVETWVFDLDNTLYPADSNLFQQIDVKMGEFISNLLGIEVAEAKKLQKRYFRSHGTTMNGLMTNHGMAPGDFLDYVHDIDLTVIDPSPKLDAALGRLDARKVIYTNGPLDHAERVMDRLGVAHHFEGIFDIVEADYRPKPKPEPLQAMLKKFAVDPTSAVMVEDIARNLEPAHAAGMTTVWVRSERRIQRGDKDGPHIHHVTEDLVAWLEAVAPPA